MIFDGHRWQPFSHPVAYAPTRRTGDDTWVGEVRYDLPEHAQEALQQLDGSDLMGSLIKVSIHGVNNPAGTKLLVTGIPSSCGWQELKDHFKVVGTVAFAGTSGKSKGKGGRLGGDVNNHPYADSLDGLSYLHPEPYARRQHRRLPREPEHPPRRSSSQHEVSMKKGAEPLVTGRTGFLKRGSDDIEANRSLEPPQKQVRYDDEEVPVIEGVCAAVDFETREEAHQALTLLNGIDLGGSTLEVDLDHRSSAGTGIAIRGLPEKLEREDLEAFCGQFGRILTCQFIQDFAPGSVDSSAASTGLAGSLVGEVRFDDPEHARQAIQQLNGSQVGGSKISVSLHGMNNPMGSKLLITGLPAKCAWQELKDLFVQFGPVAFAGIVGGKGKGKPLMGRGCGAAGAGKGAGGFGMASRAVIHGGPRLSGAGTAPVLAPGSKLVGEVRFELPEQAQMALQMLDGSELGGAPITVRLHGMNNPMGTKLVVTGIPSHCDWRDLDDLFCSCGEVAFAGITSAVPPGGGPAQPLKGSGKKGPPARTSHGLPPPPITGSRGSAGNGPANQGYLRASAGCSGTGSARNGTLTGEVRYDFPEHAQQALRQMHGSFLGGSAIGVFMHMRNNPAGTKLLVTGIPATCGWQDLKSHFARCGQVAFADC